MKKTALVLGVIGLGKLGLSFSLLAEHKGFKVLGSDISEDYISHLNHKTLKSDEPYVEQYLKDSKNFYPTTNNVDVIGMCKIIFTFVPTPSLPTGEYDHTHIEEVIETFESVYNLGIDVSGKTLVIGCTTNPGYVDTVTERLNIYGIDVVYNPEFIAQGDIINGLRHSDIVLIGSKSKEAIKNVKKIYRQLMDSYTPNFKVMSNTAAEITKISINCFLTTKISFANMIGEICHNTGISSEVETVLSAIGDDSRIGNKYLKYGFGFGGPCLPRDNRALGVHAEKVGLEVNLPLEVDKFNIEHHKYLVNKLVTENPNRDTNFIFESVTYKKGIDIITESQQLNLLLSLLDEGYTCTVVDNDNVRHIIEEDLKKLYNNKFNIVQTETINNGIKIEL